MAQKTMSKEQKIKYIRENLLNYTYDELAPKLGFKNGESLRKFCNANKVNKKNLNDPQPELTAEDEVERDTEVLKARIKSNITNKKYSILLRKTYELQDLLEASKAIKQTPQEIVIPKIITEDVDATFIAVFSDWHCEEPVLPGTVNGLNEYNLKIADYRIEKFFQNTLRLIKKEQKCSTIDRGVIALLGDFISGSIHEELMEQSLLAPIDAIIWVQSRIVSGINFLLKNTNLTFDVICNTGNHGRTTKRIRHSTEAGNSLEALMYKWIASLYVGNKRINFIVAESYHTYYEVFGYKIRFHHGHNIRYAGGVGGIFIPAYKAIAQWNKAKYADLDIFAHFHQKKDGGNFLCNGSGIGYNGYALSIKADFEEPKQTFVSIVKGKGKAGVYPIWGY